MFVKHVTVRKGGHLLFHSRATASYPNRRRMDTAFTALVLAPANNRAPVLNLAARMQRFRRDYRHTR
jgi:hypothetical protein